MRIIWSEEPGAEILSLDGRLTAGNRVETLRRLENALLEVPRRQLILDLSAVDYLDAAGIGEILRLHRAAAGRGIAMVIAGLPARVRDVLRVTQVAGDLDIVADRDQALARLRPQPQEPARPPRRPARALHDQVPAIVAP